MQRSPQAKGHRSSPQPPPRQKPMHERAVMSPVEFKRHRPAPMSPSMAVREKLTEKKPRQESSKNDDVTKVRDSIHSRQSD